MILRRAAPKLQTDVTRTHVAAQFGWYAEIVALIVPLSACVAAPLHIIVASEAQQPLLSSIRAVQRAARLDYAAVPVRGGLIAQSTHITYDNTSFIVIFLGTVEF